MGELPSSIGAVLDGVQRSLNTDADTLTILVRQLPDRIALRLIRYCKLDFDVAAM